LPPFLKDLESGCHPKRIYNTNKYADLTLTPVPDYHLLSRKDYALMNLQVSRGCPFACDFCEITSLLGHKVRLKDPDQIIEELETLYNLNWRGAVSIVDDNFIGNKKVVKTELLPAMKEWMKIHKYPFTFNIQSSINLADDKELLSLMVETGFSSAFIGIETTSEDTLKDCQKAQNRNRDLIENVQTIQKAGMQVSGGFIVGFDNDSPTVFQQQIDFIQQSGIVSAMVGLLNAPKNTKLYERLESEQRLTVDATGSNTDLTMNFVPKMNSQELISGYQGIIRSIYSVKPYYQRMRQFLLNYKRIHARQKRLELNLLGAFIKSIIIIGIINKGRGEYWKLFIWTLLKRPGSFIDAITLSVYGYHYRTVFGLRNKNRYPGNL
jgi:radical SAM superfamily enzyme YgiQ (UPF0313 family)